MAAKGEANSWLLVAASQNRVSHQYIVLETSSWPWDLTPLIQGLLDSSLSPQVQQTDLWSNHHIWQDLESITSPTFGITKLILDSLVKMRLREHTNSNWGVIHKKIDPLEIPHNFHVLAFSI
jgi:hypothetical protein